MTTFTDVPDQSPAYRWVVLLTWQACSATGWMVVASMGIFLPAISEDLDLSPAQQGLLVSVAVWGNLGLAIPVSWWVSRYSPKLLSSVTQLLAALFVTVQGWAPGFAILLLGRLALGATLVAREPARAMLTQQWFPLREVALLNSFNNAIYTGVVGGGLALAPFVLAAWGGEWRNAFLTYAVVLGVLLGIWMVVGRDRVTAEYRRLPAAREAGVVRGALGHRDLWLGGLGYMGATMAQGSFTAFFPTMMLETHDVPLKWSGAFLALSYLSGGFSGFGIVFLSHRLGRGNVTLQTLGMIMAGTFLGLTLIGFIPLLLLLAILNGVAWGFWPVLFSIPFRLPNIGRREVAVATAFIMMMITSGMALGPLAAGLLQELTGDVRQSLWILCFGPLSLTVAGTFLRPAIVGARPVAT